MASPRPFVFCLVPAELSAELLEPLRAHFADEPMIDVIVERRGQERTETFDDRVRRELASGAQAEQRAPVVPRADLVRRLPPALAVHADRLRFVQRLTPVRPGLEDSNILDVVDMMKAGDPDAPSELYWRSFERVHRRLQLHLRTPAEADRAIKGAFGRIFARLPDFDPARHPLPIWIDAIVDEHAATAPRDTPAPVA